MKYKDYYAILGVEKAANEKDIKKAYRKLARKFHPDINHDAGAEQKFKEATEAYDVIGDPEKRKKYDELGANWKAGQDFSPPPGWHPPRRGAGADFSSQTFGPEDFGGFSDFFSTLFGGDAQSGHFSGGGPNWRMRGQDHEASMDITLEEAVHGTRKAIALQTTDLDEHGRIARATKNMQVNIPPGTGDNARIRLAGQGGSGMGGAPAGHLYLRVHIQPHPRIHLKGRDLQTTLQIPPYDAALGARIMVEGLDGRKLALNLPAGTSSGTQLRLKGRGLPASGKKPAGDLLVQIKITIPKTLSEKERALYEELKKCADA